MIFLFCLHDAPYYTGTLFFGPLPFGQIAAALALFQRGLFIFLPIISRRLGLYITDHGEAQLVFWEILAISISP